MFLRVNDHKLIMMIKERIKLFGIKPLCNLKADRAPKICGFVFPLCYRCTGLLIGGALAFFIRIPVLAALLFMVPMIVDIGLQYNGAYPSNNFRRLISGLLFGASLGSL